MRVVRGVVYMTKSSGPRTEPWGTPQEEVCQEDRSVSHFTRKQRNDRCDLNQLRTEPSIPNQDERLSLARSFSNNKALKPTCEQLRNLQLAARYAFKLFINHIRAVWLIIWFISICHLTCSHVDSCVLIADSQWLVPREFPRLARPSPADPELYHTHCVSSRQRQASSASMLASSLENYVN